MTGDPTLEPPAPPEPKPGPKTRKARRSAAAERKAAAKAARRRRHPLLTAALALTAIFAIVFITSLSLRVGVQTSPGRAVIARLIDGLKLSRFGRLHLEGLQGDLFHQFHVRRVTVADAQGVWLEINDLDVRWQAPELLAKRFHAESIRAAAVRVLRRPVLSVEPKRPQQPNPLTVVLDEVRLSLETLPAFSTQPGLWDVAAQAVIERTGPARGRLEAISRLHKGDGATLVFDLGGTKRVVLRLDAIEGQGGALAGSIGLPADQTLTIQARADGTAEAGQLSFTTTSGKTVPARAEAHWSKAGTTLDGYIALAASHFTQRLVERMGPEARLKVAAVHDKGDLYRIDASLVGAHASVTAKGPIDWRKRRTGGLDVKLALADLSKWWVPVPKVGPAQASGTMSGDLRNFTYKGRMAVQKIEQFDYALTQASGPATFTRKPGEWRLQADLQGEGGHGTVQGSQGMGLVAALLGPRPTAVLDGARIADGRFLFKVLKVDGPGLKVDGEGGQSLFGGLTFKGSALVSNLAAAHKGAHGLLTATWNATEPKGVHLWDATLDAKGTDFVTGFPEFDRLLGTNPHITARAGYGPVGWTILESHMDGGALQIAAKGTVDHSLVMALDLDWSAKGPFTAGPIQIDGLVKGGGRVGGKIALPWADLTADLVQVDFGRLVVKPAHLTVFTATAPEGASGQIALSGPSNYGQAAARAAFHFLPDGLALSEINADAGGVKLTGDVALRGGAPSTADLDLVAGPGAFLASGKLTGSMKIADRPGGATAEIVLDGQNLSIPGVNRSLPTARLRAQGPWARLPFEISAESDEVLDWRFVGNGVLNQTTPTREITLSGQGRVKRADLRLPEPAVFRMGPDGQSLRLRAQLGSGRADIDARQTGDVLEAKAELRNLGLAAFDQDFVGQFDGDMTLSGKGPRLTGALDATLTGARSRDAPANQALTGRIHADIADGRLHLDAGATNSQLQSQLAMDIPATTSAAPFRLALVGDKPLKGSFNIDGEVRALFDLWAGGARTLAGRMVAKGTIQGTLADMESVGQASFSGGRFQDVATGLDLRDLDIQAAFGDSSVTVSRFAGVDGRGGSVSGDGKVSLVRDGASTFTLNLSKFQLIDNEIARATASGPVTVTRDAKGQANLKGKLTVDRADIVAKPPVPNGVVRMDVIEINKPGRQGQEAASKPAGPQIGLDVDISARRGVFVRGNGLDVELRLDSHVGGAIGRAELSGEAQVVRGDYQFAGKRFEFDNRGTIRLGSTAEAIRLDLQAIRDDPTLSAVVRIQGTAAKPEITLSSTPILPEDEILSQVLFGRSASQLSSLEAAQLAAALTTLATGGGFDVLGGLRQFAGLDRLALGGGISGMGISGGKYINDDLYLEITGGGREGPTAQLEWRIRRNLSVVSTVGTQGDARLSIRWRKTY